MAPKRSAEAAELTSQSSPTGVDETVPGHEQKRPRTESYSPPGTQLAPIPAFIPKKRRAASQDPDEEQDLVEDEYESDYSSNSEPTIRQKSVKRPRMDVSSAAAPSAQDGDVDCAQNCAGSDHDGPMRQEQYESASECNDEQDNEEDDDEVAGEEGEEAVDEEEDNSYVPIDPPARGK